MTPVQSNDATSDEAATATKLGFFAIDRQVWEVVCDGDMKEAVAYLVLARGSGGDNHTTSWSVHAIEKHTGIGRPRAKQAVEGLVRRGLVRVDKAGTKPRYYLLPAHQVPGCRDHAVAEALGLSDDDRKELKPHWIWLPNSLIDGVVEEVFAPVEQLRRTHKLAVLRLFVRLYDAHAFTGEGGVNWRSGGIRQRYRRVRVAEHGERVIWGFEPMKVEWDPEAPVAQLGSAFLDAWQTLTVTGLVEMVAHLVEADTEDAEIIHPVAFDNGDVKEELVTIYAGQLAEKLVGCEVLDRARERGVKILVPVLRHLSEVRVVGIARLRHRPHTKMTKAWYEKMSAACDDWGND